MSKKFLDASIHIEVWEGIKPKAIEQMQELIHLSPLIHSGPTGVTALLFSREKTYDFEIAEFLKNSSPEEREKLKLLAKIKSRKAELVELENELNKLENE